MGLDEFLAGMKPETNDGFDQLDGIYKVVLNWIVPEVNKFTDEEQYRAEVQVVEVLDGNGNPGRKLWKRYSKDEEGVQRLVNDLFTAGITVDLAHGTAGFEDSLQTVVGKTAFVRAWTTTPSKTKEGTPIAEEERKTYQNWVMTSEKRVGKLVAKLAATPF